MIFTLKYWRFRSAIILLFLIAFSSSAQQLAISGVVYNEKGKALPWVNIGIRNKNVGITSAQDGTYQLIIPEGFEKEQLVFSCVGFEEYLIAIKDLTNQQQKIILYPKTILLNEVVITNQKRRVLTLGTKGYTPLMWMNVGSKTGNYAEHGKLIEIKAPSKLLNASVRVGGDKKSKDSVIYRLNVYKVAKGLPSQRMMEKNIIKIFPSTAELLTFDLTKEDIYLDEDCVVSFEYIPKDGEKKQLISLRANVSAGNAFFRDVSVGEWRPMKGGSAAIFVQVEQ